MRFPELGGPRYYPSSQIMEHQMKEQMKKSKGHFRWTPQPVIVILWDNGEYIRACLYSYYHYYKVGGPLKGNCHLGLCKYVCGTFSQNRARKHLSPYHTPNFGKPVHPDLAATTHSRPHCSLKKIMLPLLF